MFADLTSPTPGQIAGFLGCLYFLVAGWNEIESFFDRHKEHPAPAETYATKPELQRLAHDISDLEDNLDRLRDQLRTDHDNLLRAGEERATRLHERINAVFEAVSVLKGKVNA